jgi:hypothetical protein
MDPAPLNKVDDPREAVTPERVETMTRLYDGEIRSMDEAFGQLIDYLVEKGLYDDTIVIFTSDHGEALGEHGAVAKHSHTRYDELLHVPLIVKLPGSQLAATAIDQQVRSIDIMPTLLDILDLEPPADTEGWSLVRMMHGRDTEPLVAISQQDTSDPVPPTSIRTDERKLILRPAILANEADPYQWFRQRADFSWYSAQIVIPIASIDEPRPIEILIDGEPHTTVTATTDRRIVEINLRGRENKNITVRTPTPCKDAAQAGIEADDDCVAFRIFNPYEFYLVDRDPGERDNRYEDPDHSVEISQLRRQLAFLLAGGKAAVEGQEVELDEKTKARLRSLGYMP